MQRLVYEVATNAYDLVAFVVGVVQFHADLHRPDSAELRASYEQLAGRRRDLLNARAKLLLRGNSPESSAVHAIDEQLAATTDAIHHLKITVLEARVARASSGT